MIELKILGSFITASATILVALATYIWKIQREKKESNRTIIYLLLELRNVFINSVIMSIGTLMAPPICGLMEPLKTVIFALKQGDYFSLFPPRPV